MLGRDISPYFLVKNCKSLCFDFSVRLVVSLFN